MIETSKITGSELRGLAPACPPRRGEQSTRSRARKSSKDKWGRRILRCGRFPSGFPRDDERRTSDVRVAATYGRESTRSRGGGTVPRERTRPHLYGLSVRDLRYLMRSFPEKPQRNGEQHATMRTAEGNDTPGTEPSIIPRRFASALA